MTAPIQLSDTLFPTNGFNPGSGLLAVCVKDEYDFDGTLLEDVVEQFVPVAYHYGRPSPYLSGKGRNLVYASVAAEVRALYDAWNARMKSKQRHPIVNRQWLDTWLQRMHMDKDDTINRLGTAWPLDTVSLGVTPKGGRKLVINTFEEEYGRVFARRRREAYSRLTDERKLLDALTDVAVLTALAKLGRMAMYYAIADAAGWRRIRTLDHSAVTLTSGIDMDTWQVFDGEVIAREDTPFLLPADTGSWVGCSVGKRRTERTFPWRVIHSEQGLPSVARQFIQTRVSLTCLPPKRQWLAKRMEERLFP